MRQACTYLVWTAIIAQRHVLSKPFHQSDTLSVEPLPSSEYDYLQDFYDATGGPYWRVNYTLGIPWDFSANADPCLDNWQGITCEISDNTYHVTKLVLIAQNLSGTVPNNVNQLTKLSDFNLETNALTGTLPSTIGDLEHLKYFVMYNNAMTGTLPDSVGYVSTLEEIDYGVNNFHGTIPQSYSNLVNLLYFYVNNNSLSGYIPPVLGELPNLLMLELGVNQFSGPIPQSFANLTNTRELIFYGNQLTGTLPTTWDGFGILYYVNFGLNYFTGTIPASLGGLLAMQFLCVSQNYLHGTIPSELANLIEMNQLVLFGNSLSGTIPSFISTLRRLNDLNLDFNNFGGTLDGVFNATNQLHLGSITVNDNQFTGTVPDELFSLPRLHTLVMAVNCFAVGLTDSMCRSPVLSILSLDGLSVAPFCRRTLLPRLSQTYVTENTGETKLPSCLFLMANLQTLHLSATGIKGTLPADITISPSLTILSLSHNILVGSIPLNFQSHPWSYLDLSYNKFSGTMLSSLAANTTAPVSLYLENNRLSGGVPASVRHLETVSVLGSNLVHCNVDATDLPQNDKDSDKYQCGSTSFELSYYTWMALVAVAAAMLLSAYTYRTFWDRYAAFSRNLTYMRMYLTVSSGTYGQWKDKIKSVAIVSRVFELLCRTALWCLAYIMLILVPLYAAFSYHYNTMTYRYAYTLSAAYLSGIAPAATLCVALLALLCWFIVVYVRHLSSYRIEEMHIRLDSRSSRNAPSAAALLQVKKTSLAGKVNNFFVYSIFGVVNLVVVIAVNYLYIYAVVYQSHRFVVISQVCIAFFKLVWSGSGIHSLVKVAMKYLVLHDADIRGRGVETRFIMLQILLTLLNNILIPCVVVAVVSESCYYNVFVSAPEVVTFLPFGECTAVVLGQCIQISSGTTSFSPPYKYDYQCSSSIIAFYAPAYITLCIMATFGVPIVEFVAHRLYSQSDPHSLIYRFIDRMLPRILKPIDIAMEHELLVMPRRYFNVNQMLVGIINLLGLLLTFGAVFPPLAVALASTLIAVTYFAKLKLGRFLCNAITARRINYVDLIEAECQRAGAVAVLYRSAWVVVVFSCLFYTLFIFDTLGDRVGLSKAFWVLIVMPLMPTLIFSVYSLLDVLVNKTSGAATEGARQESVAVEMKDLSRSPSVISAVDEDTFNALLFGNNSAVAESTDKDPSSA